MSDAPGRSDFESDDRANGEEDGWGSPVPAQYGSLRSLGPPEGSDPPGAPAPSGPFEVDPGQDRWGVSSLLRRLQGESRAAHPSEGSGTSGASGTPGAVGAVGAGSGEGALAAPSDASDSSRLAGASAVDHLSADPPARPRRWYDAPPEPGAASLAAATDGAPGGRSPAAGPSNSVYPAGSDATTSEQSVLPSSRGATAEPGAGAAERGAGSAERGAGSAERGAGAAEPRPPVVGLAAAGLAGAALTGRDGAATPAEDSALTAPAPRPASDLDPGSGATPAELGRPGAPPLDTAVTQPGRPGTRPLDSGFAEPGRPTADLTDTPAATAPFSAAATAPFSAGADSLPESRPTDSAGPASPVGSGNPVSSGSPVGAAGAADAAGSAGAAGSAASPARPAIAGEPVATEAGIDPAALGPALAGRDSFLGGRGRRRRPGRMRTRATVRHIDIGSVLRVAAMFWLVILVALVLASLLLWLFADASGSLPSIDKSVRTLFSLKAFQLHPGAVAMYTAAGGIVVAIAGMIGTVVFALIYNLIADVVGGIRVDLESVSVD